MKKVEQKDLKILAKIKQKAIKGGGNKGKAGVGCPPPEPPDNPQFAGFKNAILSKGSILIFYFCTHLDKLYKINNYMSITCRKNNLLVEFVLK